MGYSVVYCDGEVILKSSHIGQSTGCMSKQSNILSRVARPAHSTLRVRVAEAVRLSVSRAREDRDLS